MNTSPALLLTLALAGCSSYVAFDVDTRPQGASVFVGYDYRGRTPTKLMIEDASRPVSVTIELLNHKGRSWIVPGQYGSEAEAREKAIHYLWDMPPR
jgi:hypothetical protein